MAIKNGSTSEVFALAVAYLMSEQTKNIQVSSSVLNIYVATEVFRSESLPLKVNAIQQSVFMVLSFLATAFLTLFNYLAVDNLESRKFSLKALCT